MAESPTSLIISCVACIIDEAKLKKSFQFAFDNPNIAEKGSGGTKRSQVLELRNSSIVISSETFLLPQRGMIKT